MSTLFSAVLDGLYGARRGRARIGRWSLELFGAAERDLALRCIGITDALSWALVVASLPLVASAAALCPAEWMPGPLADAIGSPPSSSTWPFALGLSIFAAAAYWLASRSASALELVFGHPAQDVAIGPRVAGAAAWAVAVSGALVVLTGRLVLAHTRGAAGGLSGVAVDATGSLIVVLAVAAMARALAPVRLALADAAQIGVVAGVPATLATVCVRVALASVGGALLPSAAVALVGAMATAALFARTFLLGAGVVAERRERRAEALREQRDHEALRTIGV